MNPIKKIVAVGMSGGVDSTSTAYLLLQQGYDVIGVTMHLFDVENLEGRLVQPAFIDDARAMCQVLGIRHEVIDLRDAFKDHIMNDFVEKYRMGITPNPCVVCNRVIKYGLFMDAALALGADYFATGHYARVEYDEKTQSWALLKGLTHRKDQAYFLHQLPVEKLEKLILPLGYYKNKDEIRSLAGHFNTYISKKKDSQGICFTQGAEYHRFIEETLNSVEGKGFVLSGDGQVIGEHGGYFKYTIGQKRGLTLYEPQEGAITQILADRNELIFEPEDRCYHRGLKAVEVNWLVPYASWTSQSKIVRICQWGYELRAEIHSLGDEAIEVHFEEPVRAIAPGQYVVVYEGERIIGGGRIVSAF